MLILLQHMLSALFPGCGHFLLRRPVRAALLAGAFFCCFEGVLFSLLMRPGGMYDPMLRSSLAAGIFVWVFAHVDLIWIRRLKGAATEEVFVQGLKAFLQGALEESETLMRQLITADPYDVDARMYLSLIYKEKGDLKAARKQLRRCRQFDVERRLNWETQMELERLKGRRTAAS